LDNGVWPRMSTRERSRRSAGLADFRGLTVAAASLILRWRQYLSPDSFNTLSLPADFKATLSYNARDAILNLVPTVDAEPLLSATSRRPAPSRERAHRTI
jgi:hypothetical protein